MAKKNRKHEDHENHERWLITYADLITLLLVFFIIMYSMSKVDVEKYATLAQSLHHQFKKADSLVPLNSGIIGRADPGKGEEGPEKQLQLPKTPEEQQKNPEQQRREQELQDLMAKVNQYIAENNLQAQVSVHDQLRGVVIKLNDLVLFDLGKADLKPTSQPILQKLASLFPTLNTKISIEGHTDNLPLATGSLYKDNWGLSQARSLSVLRYFTNSAGLDNHLFVSAAYADTVPVAPNDSDENRAKNRRVEIVVLRDPVTNH